MAYVIQKQSSDEGVALTDLERNFPEGKAYCEVMEIKWFQGEASHVLMQEKHWWGKHLQLRRGGGGNCTAIQLKWRHIHIPFSHQRNRGVSTISMQFL